MRKRLTIIFHTHRSLLAIQVIFLILATLYNLSLPIYEAPDGQEYTVFVHLYDETGQLVAQVDSPPQNND